MKWINPEISVKLWNPGKDHREPISLYSLANDKTPLNFFPYCSTSKQWGTCYCLCIRVAIFVPVPCGDVEKRWTLAQLDRQYSPKKCEYREEAECVICQILLFCNVLSNFVPKLVKKNFAKLNERIKQVVLPKITHNSHQTCVIDITLLEPSWPQKFMNFFFNLFAFVIIKFFF